MTIQLQTLKCLRCGHTWIPRQENRSICPKCKSRNWNKFRELYTKSQCHSLVSKAIQVGELQRAALCENCGQERYTHAHHDDYSKPLEVRWFCCSCHRRLHTHSKSNKSAPDLDRGDRMYIQYNNAITHFLEGHANANEKQILKYLDVTPGVLKKVLAKREWVLSLNQEEFKLKEATDAK